MKKRICAHCCGEIYGWRGGRAVYCSEKCRRNAKNIRKEKGLIVQTKTRSARKPVVISKDLDRLYRRCSAAYGDCDPWLERRDYGQYLYNADFVLGF